MRQPIVIIEDDPDDLEIITIALHNAGYQGETVWFPHGEEALRYLETTEDHPSIIFSDINMHVMNGLELRRKINTSTYLKEKSIPFVFLTTNASKQVIQEAYDLTVQGLFIKPDSLKEMQQLISSVLNYWQKCKHPNRP